MSPPPIRFRNCDRLLQQSGVELGFAELKDPVKDKLKRFGLFTQIGEAFFFPTVGAAVSNYLESYPIDWVDWEDRAIMKPAG